MKEKITVKIETDQDTNYEIYLTDQWRFFVDGKVFDTYLKAKQFCRAVYLNN